MPDYLVPKYQNFTEANISKLKAVGSVHPKTSVVPSSPVVKLKVSLLSDEPHDTKQSINMNFNILITTSI